MRTALGALAAAALAVAGAGPASAKEAVGEERAADVLGGQGRGSGSGKASTTTGLGAQDDRPQPARPELSEAAVGTPHARRVASGGPTDPDMERIGGGARTSGAREPGRTGGAPGGSGPEGGGDRTAPGAGGR